MAGSNPGPTVNTQPSSNPAPPLSVRDLNVAYDRKLVLWDVSFDLEPGSLTAMIGPNGAGKSTILKAALGLVPAASGSVSFFGQPLNSARQRIAYVPQRETVDWDFPVNALDVVAMGLYRRVGWCLPLARRHREQAMEALVRVGLADLAKRQIGRLSGGQQQRVFLARALVQDADLYLMDEPFAGVDAATERAILDVLRDLRARDRSVLCVHHDLSSVTESFDHCLMVNMRVVANGPVGEVFNPDMLKKTFGDRWSLLEDSVIRFGEEAVTSGRH